MARKRGPGREASSEIERRIFIKMTSDPAERERMTKEARMTNDENALERRFGFLAWSFLRHSSFGFGYFPHAPRMRETSGNVKIRERMSTASEFFNSSTVIAPSTVNRPDFVRRKFLRCAPQPSASPMSCA